MASYITLAEYSQFLEKDGKMLSSGIVDILRKESFLLDKMQFPSINSLKAKGLRIKSLPTLQNRNLNEGYTHSVGEIEPLEENAYLFGGKVSFDHRLTGKPDLISDPAAWNVKMYATSLAYGWNSDVINNTPSANTKSVVGLRYRMARDFSGQIFDGGAVDISPDATTLSANFNSFFDLVQKALYACRDHTCDAILTSDTIKLRMESGLRQLGLYTTTTDSFGRTISTWGQGGPAIIDMGLKADQTTKIFADDEGATGLQTGSAGKSSLMFVKFGPEHVTGFQDDGGMKTFEWQTGVLKNVEMDWAAGLFITDPRSISWLYNVQAL
ncbi:MAG: hypothetical protein HY864_00790 [Chloroflexi bacterium]|nr:hypothetical protein [Chloroflexota bacterium]